MRVASVKEMLKIEEEATRRLGITTRDLMENAGRAVADDAAEMISDKQRGKGHIIIVCGKGNNGGDGFVAARYLIEKGYVPTVFILASQEELSLDAKDAFFALRGLPIQSVFLDDHNLDNFAAGLKRAALVIDAIFGFSLKGAVRGIAQSAIEIMNVSDCVILAVDVPSGLESDTGHIHGVCIKAAKTVTFTCPKIGVVTYPGADMVGELVVADIGVPPEIVERTSKVQLVDVSEASALLPKRKPDVHKKEVGRVLVMAGSQGMTGAAALTANASLKSGAGLITLGVPAGLNAILEEKLTEVITVSLPETHSHALDIEAYGEIIELCSSYDVIALGPGLSRNKSTVSLVRKLVEGVQLPMVIDADGLNALVGETVLLKKRSYPTVITPHPGELGRLIKVPVDEIQRDRIDFARKTAQEWKIVMVLKGAHSVVSSPEKTAIVPTGNPGMASAGMGDVLAGFITGFIAQGLDPYQAAVLGTYLHGLAGDLAANELTEWCLVASDIIDYLPKAIKQLIAYGK